MALYAGCLLTAALDAVFDGRRAGAGVRLACGLSVAPCVVRLLTEQLS